ncbi:MAG: 2-C-methyl-D-erythritol 2,4-cyclodiphosphate synthase, partial [Steroidobacteraceae bacterium]
QWFPDSDPAIRGADSRVLLRQVVAALGERGWREGNCDVTVIAQAPRLGPHREAMRAHLAADLGIELQRVNVKATTTEGLGFTGREEGMAAQAVVLLFESTAG